MSRYAPFTGQLYHLFSARPLSPGSFVEVNGPHDRYGIVLDSVPKDGKFLNGIRGVKPRNERVAARF